MKHVRFAKPLFGILFFIILFASAGISAGAGTPRIFFNSDGGILFKFEPPMTAEQACAILDPLKDTQADAFLPCINGYGDDQMVYPTRVAEVYGLSCLEGHTIADDKIGRLYRMSAGNVSALMAAGHDPLRLWERRCRELGKEFWPSLRMNDVHEDDTRFEIGRSQWKEKNRHLLIGADVPERYLYGTGFSWAANYAEEEVRARRLAIITEVCQTYDVDGFELDFQRHNYLFKKGQERQGMELLTDFLRTLRTRLNEIGEKKQKKIRILARVPETLEVCGLVGIDAPAWIRENLIDWIVPMSPGSLDLDADLSAFCDLARGTNCKIAGGLERSVNFYTGEEKSSRTSIEMMRAAAAAFFYQGADAVYLFNFDCHSKKKGVPFLPYEIQMLQEIGDPKLIARRNKHYFITRDDGKKTIEEGGLKQLPAELKYEGAVRAFTMTIGDNLALARREGLLQGILLRVHLDKAVLPEYTLDIRMNGHPLENGKTEESILTFENPPVSQGKNHIRIAIHGKPVGAFSPVRVEGIELQIEYKPEASK